MTADQFRQIALSFPEASESAHMDHPDFRVRGKIFATLGYPKKGWGMVKLSPEQQNEFVKSVPAVFVPAKGEWGRRGATTVHLRTAKKAALRVALVAAWSNVAPKSLKEKPLNYR